ncbi:hypothetical protein SADUNF_Sadunf12G0054500 [Salix dunnii]|uniref:Uncharacterized protein n=1 Tax=Salix dunnii TaxID=1413687 RepID=A0A835JN64_9ROSI|nr:hypothetical protein SADUNF_Sadunf12G0054500 [Salix dunnii]
MNVLIVMVIINMLINASNFMVVLSGIPKERKLLPTCLYNNRYTYMSRRELVVVGIEKDCTI